MGQNHWRVSAVVPGTAIEEIGKYNRCRLAVDMGLRVLELNAAFPEAPFGFVTGRPLVLEKYGNFN